MLPGMRFCVNLDWICVEEVGCARLVFRKRKTRLQSAATATIWVRAIARIRVKSQCAVFTWLMMMKNVLPVKDRHRQGHVPKNADGEDPSIAAMSTMKSSN